MSSTQTLQSMAAKGSKAFLAVRQNVVEMGAVRQVWVLSPVAPDTYSVSVGSGPKAKSILSHGPLEKVPVLAAKAGTKWKFTLISGRQFRISTEIPGGPKKYLTLDPATGKLSLGPLATGTAWKTQSWRCVEVKIPTPPSPSERIVHTNFVLTGNGVSTKSVMTAPFTNPIHGGIGTAADPGVYFEKGVYYLAATDVNGVWRSTDLVNWQPAGSIDTGGATFWAPEIFKMPQVPGGYAMVFCNGPNEMRVLAGPGPAGPFKPYLNHGRPGGGFPMDGHVFRDEDGQCYLFTSAYGTAGAIQVRRISPDLRVVDPAGVTCVSVLQQPSWMKELVTEGPQVFKHVKGGVAKYYLTFTANQCCKTPCLYSMGYATAPTPMGPWTLAANNPIISWDASFGYGHHCLTTGPNGGLCVLFQRDPGSFARELMVTGAHVETDGKLVFDRQLYGPKKLP